MATGHRSGVFLYQALYDAHFANQPTAVNRNDGLQLRNAYITAVNRCAPPDNKPLPSEILQPTAVLALGKIAWDVFLRILKQKGMIESGAAYPFAHGAEVEFAGTAGRLFGVYHPSQQNTQTGRVTAAMYRKVLRRIRRYLERHS